MTRSVCYRSGLSHDGYAVAAFGNLRALRSAVARLCWQPFAVLHGKPFRADDATLSRRLAHVVVEPSYADALELIEECNDCDVEVLHSVPELWPGLPCTGKMRIGCTVWECDSLPRHWPPLLDAVDRVMVPCCFNKPLFEEATGRPVFVVPHACRSGLDAPGDGEIDEFRTRHGIDRDRFVFYTINAWNARKALWDVVTAFVPAFDSSDPVVLVVKTNSSGPRHAGTSATLPTRTQVEAICAAVPDAPTVIVIDEPVRERDIELLHTTGDVYVSLARSEGWGLGMFDAAWFGNPVISTGWGGQLDYLRPQWSTLVPYTLEPVVNRGGYPSYDSHQRWARPRLDDAIDALRDHFEHPAARREGAALQAGWIREAFSPAVVRGRMLEAMQED
ncbi:MAG: hypothetical protein M5U09_08955 [Gammaproteobacteria bacterium]|nr:hypothetical protein [Gammaproteobacteria bacterium]